MPKHFLIPLHSARAVAWVLMASVIMLSSPTTVRASHAVAADVYYTHIGGLTYVFRVYFYRDCGGVPAPVSIGLTMQAPSCGQAFVSTLPQVSVTEVQPICNMGTSTCNNGPVFGVMEHSYAAVVTLPAACADWRFSYQICCRNFGISNIASPGSMTQFFFATLNNLTNVSNTAMRFNEKPIPFRCIDQPFCMDLSGNDADGDSLVYTMVTPQTTASGFVTFIGGYSANNPISSSPAMTFNSQTGQACLWPLFQGLYSMAVRATEYRNGSIIGTVQRDIQVNMVPCPCLFPLPVELTSFSGKHLGGYNLLEWTTASESGNDYFMVQRSENGDHFSTIGKVKGAGNSTETLDYLFRDYYSGTHDVYYRLEQVDHNGNFTFSDVILVRSRLVEEGAQLFPMPFDREIHVSLPGHDPGDIVVSMRNSAGVLVRQWRFEKPEGPYEHPLDVDAGPGFYSVEVLGPHGLTSFKATGGR